MRITTLQEALDAARSALEIVKALQSAPIIGSLESECKTGLYVSLQGARADLDYVIRHLEKSK